MTSSVCMAMPMSTASQKKVHQSPPNSDTFFKPLKKVSLKKNIVVSKSSKLEISASSLKDKVISGLTAAGLTASMVVPDVAQAADGGSPSLKNFLLSIVAGGVVLTAIIGAVVGVSNFDPVKRS
ncbi:hypothetical protein RND71_008384 [Anisodus tanguticus]|uniref:Ultraviolet-B-repressible protein n=1 Tax=Anisodus tanguticus TaxID=243964 RepID=A0AAE1VU85_9SOLA|nr:hypothetical protein RND71_008384 [Anisodus tanguticus]